MNYIFIMTALLLVAAVVVSLMERYRKPNISEINQAQIAFTDVPSDYWAHDSIVAVVNSGFMSGNSSSTFGPELPISRAEAARYVLRLKYGNNYTPVEPNSNITFSDVSSDHWAYSWIRNLVNEGIASGCGNGKFCPDAAITRDQLAVLLVKAKYGTSFRAPVAVGFFADVPTNHWAARWIESLRINQITSGCSTNRFCPAGVVTKAQMAVFAQHYRNLPATVYVDVPPTYWAGDAVYKVISIGYMEQCASERFCPERAVTRGEMAKVLTFLRHGTVYEPLPYRTVRFGDVPLDHAYGKWIQTVVADAISSGCAADRFCPDNSVTRAQAAILILRAVKGNEYNPGAASGTVFSDVSSGAFGAAYIEQAKLMGITAGCSSTKYCPNRALTRAELAVFIRNVITLR